MGVLKPDPPGSKWLKTPDPTSGSGLPIGGVCLKKTYPPKWVLFWCDVCGSRDRDQTEFNGRIISKQEFLDVRT